MELQTDRLILRRPAAEYAEAIAAAINHWEVARWLANVPHPYTIDDARTYIDEVTKDDRHVWLIFARDVLIGGTGIANGFGYWLTPSAWGKGYATEAGRAALDGHFKDIGTDVTSQYLIDNTASGRVLSKLGFHEMGASTCSSLAAGDNLPSIRCVLTKADWDAKR